MKQSIEECLSVIRLCRQFEDWETISAMTGLSLTAVKRIIKENLSTEERKYLSKEVQKKWKHDYAGSTYGLPKIQVNKQKRKSTIHNRLPSLIDYEEELKRKHL